VVGNQIGNLILNPSFGHNLCFKYPNGSCEFILNIYVSKVFSNGIRIFLIQWVLTHAIVLWKFESPLKLQLPKWEPIWECVRSFPHILLHSQEMKCDSRASFFACTFASPCLGHEPKARVVTLLAICLTLVLGMYFCYIVLFLSCFCNIYFLHCHDAHTVFFLLIF
jgi:hypothetical protein